MIFDIVVIAALLISALIAFLRGFIREVLTIMGVVGGGIAAYFLGPLASPIMQNMIGGKGEDGKVESFMGVIPYPLLADGLTYGTIFIIFVIMLSVISHFLAEGAKSIGLGALDRTFGVIFGIARGILLLALIYLPFHLLVEEKTRDQWFAGCRSCLYVDMTANWIAATLGPHPGDNLKKAKEGVKNLANDTRKKLENIEVLHRDNSDILSLPSKATSRNKNDGAGYKKEQRRGLNNLFEENINE